MDENLPAYYCMYGEEWVPKPLDREQQQGRGKLCFLSEYEAPDILTSLAVFFERLTDDTALFLCGKLCGVTEEFQGDDYRGYAENLQTFLYDRKSSASLQEAPWIGRPDLGIYQINAWMKKRLLEIPAGSL